MALNIHHSNSFPHTWALLGRLCLRVTSSSGGNSLHPVVYYSIIFSPLCGNSSLDILVPAYIQRKEQHALVNRRAFWCLLPQQSTLVLNNSHNSILSIQQSKGISNCSPSTDVATHTWDNHFSANMTFCTDWQIATESTKQGILKGQI